MLKKIASKIKSLFGSKPKKTVTKSEIAKKEISAPHKHNKSLTHEKLSTEHKQRRPYKKETKEEYRLRHEKKALSQKKIEKPAQVKPAQEVWDESLFKVPAENGKTRFHDFKLPTEILHAVYDLEFSYCTEVQAETLPKSLAGEDITAQAQTGTGKTAAFLITIFHHFLANKIDKKRRHGTPRALILAPTRELVLQIEKDARALGKYVTCKMLSLLGGVDYAKQLKALKYEEVDILICTPGRLIDFMMKNLVDLSKIELLIIDEADRMLDMGFIPSVKKIIASTPAKAKRQTMFFSATISGDVKRLAESWTRQAFQVNVKPDEVAVKSVEQIVYITTVEEKKTLLYNLIMQKNLERVLVFVNRRDEAKHVKETFEHYGISCALLSGDVDQPQRIKRLERFREGKVRVLVATDVASRGIHVEGISHVINYNIPQDVEEYVHRIGRTGRAGATGISISFADENDSHELPRLEEYLGKKLDCVFPEEDLLLPIPEKHQKKNLPKPLRKEFSKRDQSVQNRNYRSRGKK
ncbi:MAG: ATP-dependent RNA helicase RhlB [Ignavibacteria bacterium]|nr:MAG: ATP-dependent RNA helicase RhlB [Ignavibacteria bacterium]KAF0158896.1 MAG: ATP-dependent RNA helicase RhlB [Ignavibacteria bacterium]